MELYFTRPDEYWIASQNSIPLPDLSDDSRYVGFQPLDWSYLATTIDHVVSTWDNSHIDSDGYLQFTIPDPPDDQTRRALVDWGRGPGMCPRSELGEAVTDGRHRLAGIWAIAPDLAVPLRSTILGDAKGAPDEGPLFIGYARDRAIEILERCGAAEIDMRHPANDQYVKTLISIAYGFYFETDH